MELIDEGLFDYSESANKLKKLIIKFSKNIKQEFSFRSYISYELFEETIRLFILDIMKYYLERTQVSCKKPSAVIDFYSVDGEFNSFANEIFINKEIVNSLYKGKISELCVVFHELVHFKMHFDIFYKKIINEDTVRILKEQIIRCYVFDNDINRDDVYYLDNYKYISGEVYAEKESINLLVKFFYLIFKDKISDESVLKDIVNEFEKAIKDEKPDYERRYSNKIRDFYNASDTTDVKISFEDAFDYLIKYNTEWLDYPQIDYEYQLVNGIIIKRNNIRIKEENELFKNYVKSLKRGNLCR